MKEFSELNIQIAQTRVFEVPQITIEEILNEKIEVVDFQLDVTTRFGDGRSVVLIRKDDKQMKFFTDSKRIKSQLDQVQKEDLPFAARIIVLKFGERKKSYQFT